MLLKGDIPGNVTEYEKVHINPFYFQLQQKCDLKKTLQKRTFFYRMYCNININIIVVHVVHLTGRVFL
jgi:hypothetical protein